MRPRQINATGVRLTARIMTERRECSQQFRPHEREFLFGRVELSSIC